MSCTPLNAHLRHLLRVIRTREQSSVMAAGLGAVQMLQKSLSDAQKDLRSTNDALRRLTGRDPERPT